MNRSVDYGTKVRHRLVRLTGLLMEMPYMPEARRVFLLNVSVPLAHQSIAQILLYSLSKHSETKAIRRSWLNIRRPKRFPSLIEPMKMSYIFENAFQQTF